MTLTIKKLAILLLLFISLFSSISFLVQSIRAWNPRLITNDGVYDWDVRLANLRAHLPPDVNIVGYISDWDLSPDSNDANNETEYVLTQYAMAPIVVTRSDQHGWVIVNLKRADFQTWAAGQPATIQANEYGPGLYLVYKP